MQSRTCRASLSPSAHKNRPFLPARALLQRLTDHKPLNREETTTRLTSPHPFLVFIGTTALVRNGATADGRQRYLCRTCGRRSTADPHPNGYPQSSAS